MSMMLPIVWTGERENEERGREWLSTEYTSDYTLKLPPLNGYIKDNDKDNPCFAY
jgi:hypothetical protein